MEYNRYVVLDAGIGSDLESMGGHISRWKTFTKHGKIDEAERELDNFYHNVHFIMSGMNLQCSSFACLVEEVDGVPFTDISQENIEWLVKKLSKEGLTIGKLQQYLSEIKKNLILNLRRILRVRGIRGEPGSTTKQ